MSAAVPLDSVQRSQGKNIYNDVIAGVNQKEKWSTETWLMERFHIVNSFD